MSKQNNEKLNVRTFTYWQHKGIDNWGFNYMNDPADVRDPRDILIAFDQMVDHFCNTLVSDICFGQHIIFKFLHQLKKKKKVFTGKLLQNVSTASWRVIWQLSFNILIFNCVKICIDATLKFLKNELFMQRQYGLLQTEYILITRIFHGNCLR